jgi:hypothetical protein
MLSDFTLGVHAGALHDRHGVTSAGATLSALVRAGDNQVEIRAGAAAAPDEHRGASVTSLGATVSRFGVSLSVRSNLLPPMAGRMRDSVIVGRDTTYRLGYIEAGRPRRLYTACRRARRVRRRDRRVRGSLTELRSIAAATRCNTVAATSPAS